MVSGAAAAGTGTRTRASHRNMRDAALLTCGSSDVSRVRL